MLKGDRRKTKCNDFIINKISKYLETNEFIEVFDIEVDCDTHSFILDNCIVHNSGCLTTQQTGVGYPMASLISECKEIARTMENPAMIVADGGMKDYSDIIKALALGADYVMLGSILNKALESSGQNYFYRIPVSKNVAKYLYEKGFKITKKFRGMSTKEAQKSLGSTKLKTSEGVVRYRPVEYTLNQWIMNFKSYLKSAMSYTNSPTLEDFKGNVNYNKISDNSYKRFKK